MISRLSIAALCLGLLALPLAAQPAYLDQWTTVGTANFRLHTDAPSERGVEIVRALELFRGAFARLAPELEVRSPAPTWLYAFRDAEGYAPYKTAPDADGAIVLGQFLAHRDGNFVTFNADPRYLGSFAVIYHEYVHHLVQHNLPGVPRWLNEGLAEYYSTFALEGERAVVGRPVARHQRWIARNAELRLDEVLSVPSGPGAPHPDPATAGRFYAVSWALTHYLLAGGDAAGSGLADYLDALAEGDDPETAFERIFDASTTEMERRIAGYVHQPTLPTAAYPLAGLGPATAQSGPARPAEVLAGLGDLLLRAGRSEAAERHYRLALDWSPGDPRALAGLAWMRSSEGRLAEAEALFTEALSTEALATGAAEPLTWLVYGRHSLDAALRGGLGDIVTERQALAERAREAFGTAAALDPSYAEAWAMLGIAHLAGEADPVEGIAPLERALALAPGRADLHLALVRLLARANELDRAAAVAAGDLERLGGAEMVADATEEIERWRLIHAANEAMARGDHATGLALVDEAISVTSDPEMRAEMQERLEALERRVE